jgi:hypothetical protein
MIFSEAHLKIRFLGMDKRITLISEDRVGPDLGLASFRYEQQMDDRPLKIEGSLVHGRFEAVQKLGSETKIIRKDDASKLYPASVINLYPVIHGLRVGANHHFTVFDPQTQTFEEVAQRVAAFEESQMLALEPSFRIETRMHGQDVSTWISPRGEPLLEMAMGGVLITYKEPEKQARQFLADASLNKKDVVLDFSLVKTEKPLCCPREAVFLKIFLDGIVGQLPLLDGPGQRASEQIQGWKKAAMYQIRAGDASPPAQKPEALSIADRTLYLSPTHHIESDHPEIKKIAADIVGQAATPKEKIRRLVTWIAANVKSEAVDSVSALDVLHTRRGECQAQTLLYSALARAVGVPTKLAGGLVYMEGMGFLYHSWAESYVDGWIAVDPTFNQVGADATHIKLVEGPSWTSTLPLGGIAGKVKADVIDYRASCGPCEQKK